MSIDKMSIDKMFIEQMSVDQMTRWPFFKLVFKTTPSLTSSTLKQFLQHFMFRVWRHFFKEILLLSHLLPAEMEFTK
jgi:hypothetical protein